MTTIHSFDETPERKVRLPGVAAAWSPDESSLASIAEGSDGEVVLWVTDAWGTGETRQIAALRDANPRDITHVNGPCIQWQPEVPQ